jgi:hypothetical protein
MIAKLRQHLFAIQPIVMGSMEMLLIRSALAWVLCSEFFFGIAQAGQTMPVGMAHFMDLSFLQSDSTFTILYQLFLLASAGFVLGIASPLATAYMLFLISAVGSLRNSYGNIHHGTQIMGMVILGYFVGYLWSSLRPQAGRSLGQRLWKADRKAHEIATQWALQAAVATYVVAGLSKIDASGWGWITGLVHLPLHVEKIGFQHYLGLGEMAPYTHAKEMAAMLAHYPLTTTVLVGSGLFFELFAFWALFSRAHAAVFGVILWVMHVQIVYLMQLTFPMNSWVLLVLFINVPYLLMWLLRYFGVYDDRPRQV